MFTGTASAGGIGSGALRRVPLGAGSVWIRDVRGADERAVGGASSVDAVRLVDRLLEPVPGAVAGPGDALHLTVPERDRVLLEVHRQTFGDRVVGTAVCARCASRFDLDFPLEALGSGPLARSARLPGGQEVRVPTGADEIATADAEDPATALLERCAPPGVNVEPSAVSEALERAAPTLDLDADAPCPECGAVNVVQFSMQRHLLDALVRERRRLLEEVHLLATAYGWSWTEILEISRNERRSLVALLQARSSG